MLFSDFEKFVLRCNTVGGITSSDREPCVLPVTVVFVSVFVYARLPYTQVTMSAKCGVCDQAITKTQKHVSCEGEGCDVTCHKRCVPIGCSENWKCVDCRGSESEPTLKDVLALIKSSTEGQSSLIKTVEANLGAALESCNSKIDGIAGKVAQLESDVTRLSVANEELQNKVFTLEERLISAEQYSRVNDVDVNGIPYKKGENLGAILDSLGRALAFPLNKSNVEVAHRVGLEGSSRRGIYIRFERKPDKEAFIHARKVKRNLCLKDLDAFGVSHAQCDDPIFINDSLCVELRKVVNEARRLKREEGLFAQVWVTGAKLYIKKSENSPKIQVKSMRHLRAL